MTELDTAAYLDELAQTLASHGSNLAALRMAELEQKVSPYLAAPGAPSSPGSVGGAGEALAGLDTAYSTSVAMGAAGLFITDGAIQVTNPGSTVIIDGTSDMFKIQATGTLSINWPATADGTHSTNLTLSGLAAGGLPHVEQTVTADQAGGMRASVIGSEGAAYKVQAWTLNFFSDLQIYLGIWAISWTFGSSYTAASRFYVMKESAI